MPATRVLRATATRTIADGKATLTVTHATYTWTVGGKRAERAQAVLIGKHPNFEPVELIGTRADLAAARAESARMCTQRATRTRFGKVPVTPWEWVIAVPVDPA